MPERIGTFTVCQKNPVAADKRANGSMLSPLNGHSRRVAFVRGESGLRSQTLLANTSLLCAAPNIGASVPKVGTAARTRSARRRALWGSGSFFHRRIHYANLRCVRTRRCNQVAYDTGPTALIPPADMGNAFDCEWHIGNAGDRRNADDIDETTNQAVWRVLRIVL